MFSLKSGYHNIHSNRLTISLGLHNKEEPSPYTVNFGDTGHLSVFIHEKYNQITLENDIALITLNRKVAFNEYVRPICLPEMEITNEEHQKDDNHQSASEHFGNLFFENNTTAHIAGWHYFKELLLHAVSTTQFLNIFKVGDTTLPWRRASGAFFPISCKRLQYQWSN